MLAYPLQPEQIASISQETYNEYTISLRRQVLFGCRDPFSQSPEISAFQETFNGRIAGDSVLTLGEVLLSLDSRISLADLFPLEFWFVTQEPPNQNGGWAIQEP
jgi:hypothetical protein